MEIKTEAQGARREVQGARRKARGARKVKRYNVSILVNLTFLSFVFFTFVKVIEVRLPGAIVFATAGAATAGAAACAGAATATVFATAGAATAGAGATVFGSAVPFSFFLNKNKQFNSEINFSFSLKFASADMFSMEKLAYPFFVSDSWPALVKFKCFLLKINSTSSLVKVRKLCFSISFCNGCKKTNHSGVGCFCVLG